MKRQVLAMATLALALALAACANDECIRNSDCNDGLVCSNVGACVIKPVDGGLDADTPDASPIDDDGGVDAGLVGLDASTEDAGPDASPDATPIDLSVDLDPPQVETD